MSSNISLNIPLYDLSIKDESYKKKMLDAINKVIGHTQFIFGDEVQIFEKRWAKYCNYRYAIGLNSGTDSLEAAIRSHNIDIDKCTYKKDKFVVPVNTYTSTAMAVYNAGFQPIFVDCNEEYGINIEELKNIIENQENIIGIIPVHLYGIPENISQINNVARKHGLIVIEDAAQAHGLKISEENKNIKNDKIYSFYPTKNLGAFGDAGIVVTDSKERAPFIEKWRNQGRITHNTINHEILGVNSRLDTIQAAILDIKLDYLDIWNKNRYNSAQLYNQLLSNIPEITLPPNRGVYHFYVIRIKKRDKILKILREKGIGCSIHYPVPLHLQGAYKNLGYKKGDFPIAEKLSEEIISLPMHPYLKKDDIEIVCNTIKDILK